jgi:hypothetical protein
MPIMSCGSIGQRARFATRMNVNNIRSNSGVSRATDRPQRTDGSRGGDAVRSSEPRDQAAISSDGRDQAASVDELVRRAGSDQDDRQSRVDAAASKLSNGSLDTFAVHRDIAQQLLDSGYLG